MSLFYQYKLTLKTISTQVSSMKFLFSSIIAFSFSFFLFFLYTLLLCPDPTLRVLSSLFQPFMNQQGVTKGSHLIVFLPNLNTLFFKGVSYKCSHFLLYLKEIVSKEQPLSTCQLNLGQFLSYIELPLKKDFSVSDLLNCTLYIAIMPQEVVITYMTSILNFSVFHTRKRSERVSHFPKRKLIYNIQYSFTTTQSLW